MSAKRPTRREQIVALAREKYAVDDNAKLSEGDDNGIYVQAWVWVSFEGTKFDKDK